MGLHNAGRALIRDIYVDGFGLIGLAAPVGVAVFLVLKLTETPPASAVSWGWGFAPLALWFLIAYLRRRRISANNSLTCDMPLRELVAYRFGTEKAGLNSEALTDFFDDVRSKAVRGEIAVWGRFAASSAGGESSPVLPISTVHWCDHAINADRFLNENEGRTDNATLTAESWFRDLRFNRKQIEHAFPKGNAT